MTTADIIRFINTHEQDIEKSFAESQEEVTWRNFREFLNIFLQEYCDPKIVSIDIEISFKFWQAHFCKKLN